MKEIDVNLSRGTKGWLVVGVVTMAAIGLYSLSAPPEHTHEEQPVAMPGSAHPQPTPDTDETNPQVAVAPTETQTVPGEPALSETAAQTAASNVTATSEVPVYIGHTERMALQPDMVRALRQLTDTSHDGLHVRPMPDGTRLVDTPDKFRHVAVGAITPDRRILQQDFSSMP